MRNFKVRTLVVLLCLPVCPAVFGAPPNVTQVSLRGLQLGGTTSVVFEGSDLLPDPQLIAPFPIVSQTIRPNSASNRVEMEIRLDERTAPGIYQIRLASGKGVSNPIAVGLDRLTQLPHAVQITNLPVALHGSLSGTQVVTTKFRGEKGQSFNADVEVQRLGAKFKPVLRVKDSRGRQIAWSSSSQRLGGDARVSLELPEDGEYTVELHDVLYRAAAPGFFRLKLGEFAYASLVFPLGVQAGTKVPLQFLASNIPSFVLGELDASNIEHPDILAAPTGSGILFSGNLPHVVVTRHPEVVETAPPGQRQLLPGVPVAVSGRLGLKGEEDQYLLPVQPEARLRFSIQAQRLGSPLDSVLFVRSEQGAQLATSDDRPGMQDAGLDFTVPADTRQVVVAVRDLVGRGGDEFVYRLEVEDLSQPNFTIDVETDRVNVPAGATQTVRVKVDRNRYDGRIQLAVEGLQPGVELAGTEIKPGATIGLLSFTAAAGPPAHGLGRIVATGEDKVLERTVRTPESDVTRRLPWLRGEFAVSITESAPLQIAWSDLNEMQLLQGSSQPLSVTLQRTQGVAGSVRLRLLTTQATPRKRIRENNQNKEVDDVERTLRLDAEPTVAPDVKQTTVQLLVPADLPARDWGLAVAADLLASDNKTVAATVTTAVRSFRAIVPFSVELASVEKLEAKAGLGDTGRLSGQIRRHAQFQHPVSVTLSGLPKEYPAPSVMVPSEKDTFEFDVRFPYSAKPAELKDIKLVAVYQPNPKNAELLVRSNEVTLGVINVVTGERPPVEPPFAIFEDDEGIVAALTQGSGMISLESEDKYSGKASVKVTPDQRYHENISRLNLKIREQPGPGEYRYLRFAWKKKGGATICLQINHDGMWGPGGSGKPGAKFRYHAGSGGECYGASLAVDDKIPQDFVVVSRDLFADFGEFTFTGLALSPVDGDYALFDQVYLGRNTADLEQLASQK